MATETPAAAPTGIAGPDGAREGSAPQRDEAPTRPVDYGAINAAYAALLGTFLVLSRKAPGDPEEIGGRELVPVAAATFALSKIVAREKIGSWVREPFVEEAGGKRRRPRGRRLRHAVGELVTCSRCVGAWSALAIIALRTASPRTGTVVTNVLATSAANDFLQAAFRALCEQVNQEAA